MCVYIYYAYYVCTHYVYYVCTHTYIRTYTYIRTHTYYPRGQRRLRTWIYGHAYMCIHSRWCDTHTHTYTHTCIHIYIHTCTCTCTYTRDTYTYMHIQLQERSKLAAKWIETVKDMEALASYSRRKLKNWEKVSVYVMCAYICMYVCMYVCRYETVEKLRCLRSVYVCSVCVYVCM